MRGRRRRARSHLEAVTPIASVCQDESLAQLDAASAPAPPSDFTLQFKSAHPLAAWANSPTSSTQARFRSSSSRQRGMTQLLPREQGRDRASAFCVPSLGAGVGRLMLRREHLSSIRIHVGPREGCLPHSTPEGPSFLQIHNTRIPRRRSAICANRVDHSYLTPNLHNTSRSSGSELWAKESSSSVRHALNTNSRIRAAAKKASVRSASSHRAT